MLVPIGIGAYLLMAEASRRWVAVITAVGTVGLLLTFLTLMVLPRYQGSERVILHAREAPVPTRYINVREVDGFWVQNGDCVSFRWDVDGTAYAGWDCDVNNRR